MDDSIANAAAAAIFEVGPIRPPSEARSLLVRVTRNCPWNRCTFCPVYKGTRFSLRTVEEVTADIDAMKRVADQLETLSWQLGDEGHIGIRIIRAVGRAMMRDGESPDAAQVGRFLATGGRTAFLQDANALIMKVDGLVQVLEHLRRAFPTIERVTTYARSHTARQRTVGELERLREAGLDRVHIGLESGSDTVLRLVDKGVDAPQHIVAGQRIKAAGLELSEYVMPGLGGREHSTEHARETARVLREIDPDFIRLRSLIVSPGSAFERQVERGEIEPLDDVGIVRELRQMLAEMTGMSGVVASDHMMNLLEEVQGRLPDDLPDMLAVVDQFLALPDHEQELFIVGRRLGFMRFLADLDVPVWRQRAAEARELLQRRFGDGPLADAIRQLAVGFV